MKQRLTLLISLVCLVVGPLPASAVEILTLDRGSITVGPGLLYPIFDMAGPRVSISAIGIFQLFGGGFGSPPCANGCSPGESFFVGGIWGGSDLPGARVTLDGVTHLAEGFTPEQDHLLLALDAELIAPPFGPASTAVVSGRFSITGNLHRIVSDPSFPGEFTLYGLYGEGAVDVALIKRNFAPDLNPPRDFWLVQSALYQLEPIPEPATLSSSARVPRALSWHVGTVESAWVPRKATARSEGGPCKPLPEELARANAIRGEDHGGDD